MTRYVAPPPSPPRIFLGQIPKGYLGTKSTVEHMRALIRAGVKDFYVRQKAIDILLEKRVPPKSYLGEIRALFEWVQANIRYTKDPFRLELLHSARRMLELRAGDCDDMAILLGALLEAVGHPVGWCSSARIHAGPASSPISMWRSITEAAGSPLDATMPYPMGWAPATLVRQVIPV